MSAPVIRCIELSKYFDSTAAVDSVSLDVWPGEVVAVLGTSGCGKTTLLRLIAGLEVPSGGTVEIQGSEVSTTSVVRPPETRGIGMVVQEYALFPHMTVRANVAFGLRSLDSAARGARVEEVLALVQLERLGSRFPYELSGGQQQRVALARTLAPSPVSVLLDEPFSNLDSSMRQRLRVEVESILRSQRTAAIFVTHDREEAFAIADRVGVMIDGRMRQVDTPGQVYHFPVDAEVARLTGACDFVAGTVERDGVVKTELGTLPSRNVETAGLADRSVEVLVRPDDLDLVPDQSGGAMVTSREFRGDQVVLQVKLDSGAEVRSRRRSFSTMPAGSRVRVSVVRTIPFPVYPSG